MPRRLHSLPRLCLHKPTGQGRVTLSGKTFSVGPFGTSSARREYDRLLAEWIANGRQRPPGSTETATALTVTELIAAYWRYAKTYYRKPDGRPTGELAPVRAALRFLREIYGREPAREFGPLRLQTVRQRMIDAGLSRTTINGHVQRIVRAFRWSASQELVSGSLVHGLETVPGLRRGRTEARETRPIEPVADEIVQRTLPHLSPVVADMVLLQRATGMRPAEVCSLRPCDVDTSGDVWVYAPATHKTLHHGRRRVIAIGPKGQTVLRPYLLRAGDAFCFSPHESERERRAEAHAARTTPLHLGNAPGSNRRRKPKRTPGGRYTAESYRRAIERACDDAFGLPETCKVPRGVKPPETELKRIREAASAWRAKHRWSPNQLRHSAATEIRSRFGLEAAQVVLGHANAAVTEVYAERDLAKAVSVAREVG